MSKYPIKDEVDFLIAQTQAETDIAKEIVESIRGKGIDDDKKYYEEKLSLKMLEFFKEEEKVISLYAEAKKNYRRQCHSDGFNWYCDLNTAFDHRTERKGLY